MSVFAGVALIAVFVIVLVISREALEASGIFSRPSKTVVALCVALLSTLGIVHFFWGGWAGQSATAIEGGRAEAWPWLDFILMPYAALAIAVVLCLLMSLFMKIGRKRRREEHSPEAEAEYGRLSVGSEGSKKEALDEKHSNRRGR